MALLRYADKEYTYVIMSQFSSRRHLHNIAACIVGICCRIYISLVLSGPLTLASGSSFLISDCNTIENGLERQLLGETFVVQDRFIIIIL